MATPCEIHVINSLYAIRITGCVVTRIVVSITAYGGEAMYLCVAMVILAFVSGNSLALSNDSKLLIKCIVNARTCDHNKNDFSFEVYDIFSPYVTTLNTILITSDVSTIPLLENCFVNNFSENKMNGGDFIVIVDVY